MGQFTKHSALKTFKEYFLISIGLMMYAFAWTTILMPAEVMGNGVNGVGLLIYYATGGPNGGIPLSIYFIVIHRFYFFKPLHVTINMVIFGNNAHTLTVSTIGCY